MEQPNILERMKENGFKPESINVKDVMMADVCMIIDAVGNLYDSDHYEALHGLRIVATNVDMGYRAIDLSK